MVDAALKLRFREIAQSEFQFPDDVEPIAFMLEALPLLGDPEGEFRERCVYGALHRWIVGDILDRDGLGTIHDALLRDDILFYGIGESGTDSVFLRAFSVLLLAPVLYVHRDRPYLSQAQIDNCRAALSRLLREERDLRGYISEEHWWGHVIAHAADAIGQLVRCPEFGTDGVEEILDAIAASITPDCDVFIFEEDARMAAAIVHLLERELLDNAALNEWLAKLVPEHRWTGELPNVHHRYLNARNFLRCLLFQSAEAKLPKWVLDAIQKAHDELPQR